MFFLLFNGLICDLFCYFHVGVRRELLGWEKIWRTEQLSELEGLVIVPRTDAGTEPMSPCHACHERANTEP